MLSSLQIWHPNLPLNLSTPRTATASKGKVKWNEELEEEYQNVMNIMQTSIRLSPNDPKKCLCLVIDGAKTVGTGFILIQYLNEEKSEKV